MTLENLVGRSLEKVPIDASSILKLLQAAEKSLMDSKVEMLSNDSRFSTTAIGFGQGSIHTLPYRHRSSLG